MIGHLEMRFKRQEHYVSTICNKEISSTESIKEVLDNLKKDNIEFSLSFTKNLSNSYTDLPISYGKVKVKKVYNDKVDFIVLRKSSLTNIKDIRFEDITEISAITEKNIILKYDETIDRFHLMDIEE